jgi:Zn-dependent protease/CBS domain-containing protein
MLGRRLKLFKMFGFSVHVDVSWLIIAVLVTWTLAVGVFPNRYGGYSHGTYLFMGIAGALGLFVSIIIHEFFHSIVATRFGIPMKGITLFIFGGVAEMSEEPPSPKAEFLMAIAGPASSVVLALVCFAGYHAVQVANGPETLAGVLGYLAAINAILVAFNMLPGFPLDGGRMLRAGLWHWKGDIRWATRIASHVGSGFGAVLIILGILNVLGGNFVGGMWWFLIGMFLRGAASQSYQQVIIRKAMEGEKVRRFMNQDPVTVAPSTSIRELVEDFIYGYHYKLFPVVDNGTLLGCVTLQQVKEVPQDMRKTRTVGDVMGVCDSENTIAPDTDAMKALSRMSRTERSRLMVVDGNRLMGIITLKDLLRFLSLKVELEEGEEL